MRLRGGNGGTEGGVKLKTSRTSNSADVEGKFELGNETRNEQRTVRGIFTFKWQIQVGHIFMPWSTRYRHWLGIAHELFNMSVLLHFVLVPFDLGLGFI